MEYKRLDFSKLRNKIIPFNLGLCLLKTGSNGDAIEAFKIAIKIDESFLPAWEMWKCSNEGRLHEALWQHKVLELDPKNSDAQMNLAVSTKISVTLIRLLLLRSNH